MTAAEAEYVLKREFLCGVTDREVNPTVDGVCRDLVSALGRAGMLTDPDAEDLRIAAAWGLVQAWTDQSVAALERAGALEHTEENIRHHTALRREATTAIDHAAELRGVLDDLDFATARRGDM